MSKKNVYTIATMGVVLIMLSILFFQNTNEATINLKNGTQQEDNNIVLCSDSDNGKNIFVKGYAETRAEGHLINAGEIIHIGTDSCSEKLENSTNLEPRYLEELASCSGENCYVKEVFCSDKTDAREFIKCSDGCNDGACVSN